MSALARCFRHQRSGLATPENKNVHESKPLTGAPLKNSREGR
jgi:hypothetical protein